MSNFLLEEHDSQTLKTLANTNHTFWKFSQSEHGLRLYEPELFLRYEKGCIVKAEDTDEKLSFSDETSIFYHFHYGDILTKFNFNATDPLFKKIQNVPYKKSGDSYQSEFLLVEENYPLSDRSTIIMLLSMVTTNEQLMWLLTSGGNKKSFEEILHYYKFYDSEDLLRELSLLIKEDYNDDTIKKLKSWLNQV